MDGVDDSVVDLSINTPFRRPADPPANSGDGPEDLSKPARKPEEVDKEIPLPPVVHNQGKRKYEEMDGEYCGRPRRNLRPRIERNYAESPDIIILSDEEPRVNGYSNGYNSDSDEGEMPPSPPMKVLSLEEVLERSRMIRRLKEELRNEEMKLVLLKKLKQTQQMKENLEVVLPPSHVQPPPPQPPPSQVPGLKPVPGVKLPPPPQQAHQPPSIPRASQKPHLNMASSLVRGHPPPARSQQNLHLGQSMLSAPQSSRVPVSLPPNMNFTPQPLRAAHEPPIRGNMHFDRLMNSVFSECNREERAPSYIGNRQPVTTPPNVVIGYQSAHQDRMDRIKDAHPSPTHVSSLASQERLRIEDSQSPSQRQQAAKLALRKQLEKTLLQQIPPPKPPPPEMHFIPNPSNTEFIYLLGLEHVVDFIIKDPKMQQGAPDPFTCSQCNTDFTPVWKWDKNSKVREAKVICEQCVTTNVKKALKAEHTNRLKTAFVKALQQEQEIEQRLAQVANSPQADPLPMPKSATPTTHHVSQPSPSLSMSTATPARELPPAPLPKLADPKFSTAAQSAAALHQQLLRLPPPPQPLPAHLLSPFSPLLYPYQLAMAASSKGHMSASSLAELQRQYLLDMIPPRSLPQGAMNWKT